MKIMLIDTSSANLVIGLSTSDHLVDTLVLEDNHNHSRNALNNINDLLNRNNIKPKEINKILICVGPGSYTGIRIGVTIAKTYSWSLNIPLIPVSSLDLMKEGVDADNVIPVIDARRGNCFTKFNNNECFMSIDDLKKKINPEAIITGGATLEEYFQEFTFKPLNYNIAKTIKKHMDDQSVDPHLLKPNYLKKTEAEEML